MLCLSIVIFYLFDFYKSLQLLLLFVDKKMFLFYSGFKNAESTEFLVTYLSFV